MRRIGQRKDRTLEGLRWNLLRDHDALKSETMKSVAKMIRSHFDGIVA